jgi:hypothetical protein
MLLGRLPILMGFVTLIFIHSRIGLLSLRELSGVGLRETL